jgi:isopentenyl-diphosphate delta-isomerase
MKLNTLKCMLPDYRYKTPPYKGIIEHEVCPVYVATTSDKPQPNKQEVETYQWMSWTEFQHTAAGETNDTWSWWSKDQLKQLVNLSLDSLLNITNTEPNQSKPGGIA